MRLIYGTSGSEGGSVPLKLLASQIVSQMEEPVIYRSMRLGEEVEICDFVKCSFDQFVAPDYSQEGIDEFMKREHLILDYAAIPDELESAITDLTDDQLDTACRPGGWTVRQVVHHLADSHVNAYARFKQVLTEDEPRVNVADQEARAELPDARTAPVATSVEPLRALHQHWVAALQTLSSEDYERKFWHPWWGNVSLDFLIQNYAWHGTHHISQIVSLRRRMRW
jgi:uncharacterized damage-inducible protein DinB